MSLTVYEPNKIQWRERPAGPEQLLLESMFEDGTIDVYCTPESVRNMRMEFREFSPRVFASHFRKTKAKFGGFGKMNYSNFPENLSLFRLLFCFSFEQKIATRRR